MDVDDRAAGSGNQPGNAAFRLAASHGAEVGPELIRIATELHRRGLSYVGLVAASQTADVASIAVQVGLALATVTGRPAGVVDAGGTWELRPAGSGSQSRFAMEWITDRVVAIAPRTPSRPGARVLELEALLRDDSRPARRLVIDLTALVPSGEHAEAMSHVDGVIILAHAGRTTSQQVERRMLEVPPEKSLGVLLVGAR